MSTSFVFIAFVIDINVSFNNYEFEIVHKKNEFQCKTTKLKPSSAKRQQKFYKKI